MRSALSILLALLLLGCGESSTPPAFRLGERLPVAGSAADANYREINWDDLAPKGWDPLDGFKREEFAALKDGDPRANEMLRKLQDAWNDAPTVPALDQQNVRIAGFLVPLDAERDQLREFLLVPYFGACIHSPPPPTNQTLHVVMDKPFTGRMMEPFWISGRLRIDRKDSPLGSAAYTLQGQLAEAYVRPPAP
ncbi:DUF3299 domain-containing protein [Uliginosibacterium sp. 31-16]|uniref:DUF3299 domain-containing protein n=1 Tax=Uliginosibacterium sp. 31-16 TaxID=3068315 RepID=UPI00273D50A6|nr:DUF3299 domain-containing protein [Uliginosibacterium sp. 31-16]MDP5238727.1 DUF3299 domain-containing protein [Uliginosibacterium sp. 31-16]